MNPYGGHYFGLPQAYYGTVPTAYPTFMPTVVSYAPVVVPPPPIATPQQAPTANATPGATSITITESLTPVTQEKTPVTTVFVGNIPERAPDSLVKSLLMVKVDPKTEDLLNEYKKKKKKDGEDGSLGSTEAEVDEATKQDDDVVKTALQNILNESVATFQLAHGSYALYLNNFTESPNRQDYLEGPRHLTLDDMDLDVDRKDLINKEIETFRRRNEKETPTEERGRRPKDTDRDYYSSRYSSRPRAEREAGRSSTSGNHLKHSRSRSPSHEPTKKRHRGSITSSALTSGHSRSSHVDEEEEAIKKRLERKLREKEESYQTRLRQWESRERKKLAEYEREKERERKKKEELAQEAQRLFEFFEDYDDELEDIKYYKGSALQRRLADREVEEAADERDRQKEIEQLEAARRKVIEDREPDAEAVILRMEQTMQEHLRKRLNLNVSPPRLSKSCGVGRRRGLSPDEEPPKHAMDTPSGFVETDNHENGLPSNPAAADQEDSTFRPVSPDGTQIDGDCSILKEVDGPSLPKRDSNTFLFSMSSNEQAVLKPAAAFTDEDVEQTTKKRTLSWLPPSATSTQRSLPLPAEEPSVARLSTTEKNAIIKRIIEQIPTAKEDLFAYPIDWSIVDLEFVNSRIRPWVDKKIVTYIGESEVTLSNFICEQVLEHNPPAKILSEIAMVLEEEAEVFVVKMWRLLIYVIAEMKLGLSV